MTISRLTNALTVTNARFQSGCCPDCLNTHNVEVENGSLFLRHNCPVSRYETNVKLGKTLQQVERTLAQYEYLGNPQRPSYCLNGDTYKIELITPLVYKVTTDLHTVGMFDWVKQVDRGKCSLDVMVVLPLAFAGWGFLDRVFGSLRTAVASALMVWHKTPNEYTYFVPYTLYATLQVGHKRMGLAINTQLSYGSSASAHTTNFEYRWAKGEVELWLGHDMMVKALGELPAINHLKGIREAYKAHGQYIQLE